MLQTFQRKKLHQSSGFLYIEDGGKKVEGKAIPVTGHEGP
jgi:hypothetical protein